MMKMLRILIGLMIMAGLARGQVGKGAIGERARAFMERYDTNGDGRFSEEEIQAMPPAIAERVRALRERRVMGRTETTTSTGTLSAPDAGRLEAARKYMEETAGEAMLVMHEGKIIAEHYAAGWTAAKPHPLASGSKSYSGVVAAAALQDGLITLDERACDTLGEWKDDPRKSKITMYQLLHLTSGLDPGESPLNTGERIDWAAALAAPLTAEPGEKFQYGPHHFLCWGALLDRKLKAKTGETYEAYMKRRVLEPLGVKVYWMKSPAGDLYLPGGALTTARDWATFGEFMRLEGNWKGKQIIDKEKLALCLKGDEANPAYGLTWWLKNPVSPRLRLANLTLMGDMGELANSTWLPGDFYMAAGAGKQRLYVIPSMKLVALRLGPVRGGEQFHDIEFLRILLMGKEK